MTAHQQAIEHLNAARRILADCHDIEDGGAPGEHPYQKPNWAMRATNAIDEALSEVTGHDIG